MLASMNLTSPSIFMLVTRLKTWGLRVFRSNLTPFVLENSRERTGVHKLESYIRKMHIVCLEIRFDCSTDAQLVSIQVIEDQRTHGSFKFTFE